MNDLLRDKFRGCLIGLACGDAVGATKEFTTRKSCADNPVTNMVGGGCWRLKPGQWTDDTSMAFAMGAAIVSSEGWNPEAVMRNFVDWRQGTDFGPSDGRGCFDIGGTTAAALSRFAATKNPFAGTTDAHTAANGCIMRLAPVPMLTFNMPLLDRWRIADEASRLTHAEPRCVDAAAFLSELLRGMLAGATDFRPCASNFGAATPQLRELLRRQRWTEVSDAGISSDGYVLSTLEAAMWACHGADDFRDAVLRSANLGGDADTTGAVAGQIAGAWYGLRGIPAPWLAKLDRYGELLAVADGLFELATAATVAA